MCDKCGGTGRVVCEYEGPVKLAPCDAPPSCPPGADDDCSVPCTCADDGGHFKFTGNATTPKGGRFEVHLGGKVYDMTLTERGNGGGDGVTIDELEHGKDDQGRDWPGERCKAPRCSGRRNCVGFDVDDDVWAAVVPDGMNIVCLECFDEMAQDKGIRYDVKAVYPVTWSGWKED